MATLYPVAGAAIAVAGADKLVGNRGYASMFRHLGWSDDAMRAAADAIGALLDDPARRTAMAETGRQRVRHSLAWEHSVPHLLAAYDQAFAARGHPARGWSNPADGAIG